MGRGGVGFPGEPWPCHGPQWAVLSSPSGRKACGGESETMPPRPGVLPRPGLYRRWPGFCFRSDDPGHRHHAESPSGPRGPTQPLPPEPSGRPQDLLAVCCL